MAKVITSHHDADLPLPNGMKLRAGNSVRVVGEPPFLEAEPYKTMLANGTISLGDGPTEKPKRRRSRPKKVEAETETE